MAIKAALRLRHGTIIDNKKAYLTPLLTRRSSGLVACYCGGVDIASFRHLCKVR